jgi:phospholipid transport system substrate-binding protein
VPRNRHKGCVIKGATIHLDNISDRRNRPLSKFHSLIAALLITISGFVLQPAALLASPADDARKLVDGFHVTLLDVMKRAETLGVGGRYQTLKPEVGERFDIKLMVALTTGRHWRTAGPDDRRRLAAAFHRFSAATYASRFSGFSGQTFRTLDVRAGPRKTQLVRTQIRRPDDTPVAITYVTRAAGKTWRIVDVLLDDGISELAVRRSEYRSTLSTGGIKELTQLLESKSNTLLAEKPAKVEPR